MAYNSPWLTWHQDNTELESVGSNHKYILYWPWHKFANFRVGQKNRGSRIVKSLSLPTPQLHTVNQFLNYLFSEKKLNSPCKNLDSMQCYYYYHYYTTVLWHHWQGVIINSEYQIQSIDSWSSWSGHTEHKPTNHLLAQTKLANWTESGTMMSEICNSMDKCFAQ